jgi:glycosyltransferase involved in cell wall biosynthesis
MSHAAAVDHPARRLNVLCYIGSMEPGGAERQVVEILKHLDRSRFAPHLCLAHRRGVLLEQVPPDVPIESFWDGFAGTWKSKLCQLTRTTRYVRLRWLAAMLRAWNIDVFYDRTYLATLDAAGACRFRPTPRLSAAVADPAVQFALYARWPRHLWRRYSCWAYHSANFVLSNSEGLRQQMIAFWQLPPENVVLQPNAVDFGRIDRLSAEPCPLPRDERFRILTVGRIDDDKGHADLLESVRELVQHRGMGDLFWQIIGTGPGEAVLRAQVDERKLSDHVQFLGVVGNPFPYYRAADVFVLPSHTEGLPNVLIEALTCGTPVISTDCPSGPREVLDNERFGRLVPVRQPLTMADAIGEHRSQPAVLRDKAAAGSQSVRERYAAATVVKRLEELLLGACRLAGAAGSARRQA